MLLTKKLLGFLNRVFDKTPDQFLALRLSYSTGRMTWKVEDAVLTTVVTDGPGQNLKVDLTAYSLANLATFLAAQPGYQLLYSDTSENSLLSSRVLLDGAGDIAASNGDHLNGYLSPLYAYLEAQAFELKQAAAQIVQMLLQMTTRTASNEWLDELGGYYGIPRLTNEPDGSYAPRIIIEVLRPRANNVAMEAAIKDFTGQTAKVTDVTIYGATFPLYDGAITHNGVYFYNASAKPIYGLFDVEYGYDLINGGDITDFANEVRALINRLRDAGTHLRALSLVGGSNIDDVFTPPTDGTVITLGVAATLTDTLTVPTEVAAMLVGVPGLDDALDTPDDGVGIDITYNILHNGVRRYNGIVTYNGGDVVSETL